MDFSYRLVSMSSTTDTHQGPVQFLARTLDHVSPFCGATLVSTQWLVTAAHCADANNHGHSYCQDLEVTAPTAVPGDVTGYTRRMSAFTSASVTSPGGGRGSGSRTSSSTLAGTWPP